MCWLRGLLAVCVTWLVIDGRSLTGRFACASPVPSSWAGASSHVTFFDQIQTQQGATANATTAGTYSISYYGGLSLGMDPPTVFQDPVSGNLNASAGSSADHLLQVSASAIVPNPGTRPVPFGPVFSGPPDASASWSNDAIIVTAPPGSSLPAAVRVNFALTASAPDSTPLTDSFVGWGSFALAGVTASYNGAPLKYFWNVAPTAIPPEGMNPDAGNNVDSSMTGHGPSGTVFAKETFHLDLPLTKSGISAPFSLSLELSPMFQLLSNNGYSYSGVTANISLSGITLPDGTPLTALGDSASLLSGLGDPVPVPEPASVALWAMAATGAAIAAVRRMRRVS